MVLNEDGDGGFAAQIRPVEGSIGLVPAPSVPKMLANVQNLYQ